MKDKVSYSVATINDLDEIYQFHYEYTKDIRSKYVWHWEYGAENPFIKVLIIGRLTGEIVATQGVMQIPMVCGTELVLSGKNESLLIKKDLRRQGVSGHLYNFALEQYKNEGFSFLWGFSRKALPTLKNADFLTYSRPVSRAVLSLDFEKIKGLINIKSGYSLRSLLLRIVVFAASAYSKLLFELRTRLPIHSSQLTITNIMKSDNDICDLYRVLRERYPDMVYIEQSKLFYEWRIKKSPLPITSYFIYDNQALVGYMYICVRDGGLELIDFTMSSRVVGHILMCKLGELIKSVHSGYVTYYGNRFNKLNRITLSLLVSYGFLLMKGPNDLVLRLFDNNKSKILRSIKNWYITGMWYEGV